MVLDNEANQQDQEEEPVSPSMSPANPLTYDPTQGVGTPAWQDSVRRQMELNAKLRRN